MLLLKGIIMAKKKVTKKATKKKVLSLVPKKKLTKKTGTRNTSAKKKVLKLTPKKKLTKKVRSKAVLHLQKDLDKNLHDAILELLRVTSTVIPDDIQKVILDALYREEKDTSAEYAMNIIEANIKLAKTCLLYTSPSPRD